MSEYRLPIRRPLLVAADMLAADPSNPYMVDAAGYLQRTQIEIADRHEPEDLDIISGPVRSFGTFAVQADHVELADHAFAISTLPEKWRLVGSASIAGTIDRHTDWEVALESDDMQTALDKDQTAQAAMWCAQAEIALADYGATPDYLATKGRYLEIAMARKAALFSTLAREKDAFEQTISPPYSRALRDELDISFAKLGMWQEVEVPRNRVGFVKEYLEDFNQLVAKAIVGELNARDVRRIKDSRRIIDAMLDVNDLARGIEPTGIPRDMHSDSMHGNKLLPAVAPRIAVKLNIWVAGKVSLYIRAGNPERALNEYVYMQKKSTATDLLDAALLMAQYHGDLQAATAAHKVYNNAFGDRLTAIQSYVATQDWRAQPQEAVAVTPIIAELGTEIDSLNDPVHQLLALARTLAVQMTVDPTSVDARSSLRQLIRSWDAIERMDSYHNELPKLASSLKDLGIQFHRQWKLASDTTGYVGYTLTAADLEDRTSVLDVGMSVSEADRQGEGMEAYVSTGDLGNWKYAAECLNEIYGEDRYVVTVRGEAVKGEGNLSYLTYYRVLLSGTWQQRRHPIAEFFRAKDESWLLKGNFDTLWSLSERLRLLDL